LLQQPISAKDTVELQIQVLDGDKVLHSEDAQGAPCRLVDGSRGRGGYSRLFPRLNLSICPTSNLFGWLWSEQAAEKSDVRVVRAFRPAFKCLLLSTGVGFQPTAGLPFRLFQLPVKPSLSKQWNLRDPYRELLEAEKNYYEEVLPAFRLTGPEAAKIIGDSSVRRGIQSLVGGWFN
jgi:hypothetical protein